MICAFGVAALAGRPLFARGQRRLPGIRKYLEFRPKFSKFVFLGCARTRIRVSKGGPTGAAENLRQVSEVSPTKKSNHAFSFFSVPKGQALGSGQFEAEQHIRTRSTRTQRAVGSGAAGAEVRARAAGFRRGGVCAVCVRGVDDKQARRARSQARKGEACACAPGPRGRARVVRAQSFGSASRCRREVGPGASRRLASRRGASPQARALPPLTHSRAPCSSYRGARRACARVRARA